MTGDFRSVFLSYDVMFTIKYDKQTNTHTHILALTSLSGREESPARK